jgi:hypothetical protein
MQSDWSSRPWWAVPAAAVLLLMTLTLFFGNDEDPKHQGTSYDASSKGFRAVYLLLDELGYPLFRSKRPTEGQVRLVFFPKSPEKEPTALDTWIRGGGVLILADESADFAQGLGIPLKVEKTAAPEVEPASGEGVSRLACGAGRVDWPGERGRVWMEAGGKPAVSVYSRGKGQVWLVNRPEMFSNRLLGKADNAVLLCRLVETLLSGRPGKLAVDEYVHGMRDRPGVVELLLEPPAVWVTLQGLLLMGLLLWHYVPRFGVLRPVPPPNRRSKEEFLEAMASLLERKGDYADAFRTARDGLVRELEQELGLPSGTPVEQTAREAARRRPIRYPALLELLGDRAVPTGASAFVKAMSDLESTRSELFDGRHYR